MGVAWAISSFDNYNIEISTDMEDFTNDIVDIDQYEDILDSNWIQLMMVNGESVWIGFWWYSRYQTDMKILSLV